MFTGIITDVGTIATLTQRDGWLRLRVHAPETARRVSAGSSVAVNGVCLTVNEISAGAMDFSILPQTVAVTHIGSWQVGERVNLECSLRVGDELSGHFVYGHVDGVARVIDVRREEESVRIRFSLAPELMQFTASKGAIAIDGTSLTIAERGADWIEVTLVEYTLEHTNFLDRKIDDTVHIECDMILKFISE